MARKLRIAVSVFFGLLTVALVVLWVRSYRDLESWQGPVGGRVAHVQTARGRVILFQLSKLHDSGYYRVPFKNFDATTELERPIVGSRTRCKVLGKNVPILMLPYWSLVMSFSIAMALSVAASWPIPQFSLRTLLIATTLVAVVLGLVVSAGR